MSRMHIKGILLFIFGVSVCAVMGWSRAVEAHQLEATQHRLDVRAMGDNQYEVSWKNTRNDINPVLPKDCKPTAYLKDSWELWTCATPLDGRKIEIENLQVSGVEVLARVDYGNGQIQVELLSGKRSQFTVEGSAQTSTLQVAKTYFVVGVEHILFGFDHLLFVFGLLLILTGWKQLAMAITAFTVAHSITLALSVTGVVNVLVPPVEAVIALSIMFLATEYAKQLKGDVGWTSKKPWLVSFTVGLLHGLGFASALRQVGLPDGEIPLALVMFNVGVEAGQLTFVAAVLPSLYYGAKWFGKDHPRLRTATAYAIGGVAAFWFIERLIS